MRRRAGLSLVELVFAVGAVMLALLVVVSTFGTSASLALHSRNRAVAALIAESYGEEVRAHPFGLPAPESWPLDREERVSVPCWVEGRPQEMEFQVRMASARGLCAPRGGNATGSSADDPRDWDQVTITVTWRERGSTPDRDGSENNRRLVYQVPVVRGLGAR